MSKRMLTRRDILKISGLAVAAPLLAACQQPAAPAATATKAATAAPAGTQAAATAAATQAPAATKAATQVAGAPKAGGKLSLARPINIKDFNGNDLSRGNMSWLKSIYGYLVRLDKDLNPQPEHAESWQFSPDGAKMTLKLRQGIKFHSGREFTSEDVLFSWQYGRDATTGSPQMRNLFGLIKEVKTPDKYTVELSTDGPNPLVFDALDTMCMMDKTVVDQISKKDAGSGPFMVTSYVPGQEFVAKRFPDYYLKGQPYLEEVTFKTIPDVATLVINLETKSVDGIWSMALTDVPRLKGIANLVADSGAGAQGMFHVMVKNKGPFENKKVRQAINWAIDRERIVKQVMSGTVEHTCLAWPRGSWAYFSDLEGKYKYDLEKSKALLAEAGVANGFETTILCSQKANPPLLGIAQIVQADLAKLKINAKIEDVEATVYEGRTVRGEFEMVAHNYGRANRDPGTTLSGATVFFNKNENGTIGFDLPEFVNLRNEAVKTLDREKRKVNYRKIQEMLLDESFQMQIAGNQSYWVYQNYVKGQTYSRESSPFTVDMWLDK
ncbi:MAG: ABC transporter substrate-binding protein [Chloroflexota bacterium]